MGTKLIDAIMAFSEAIDAIDGAEKPTIFVSAKEWTRIGLEMASISRFNDAAERFKAGRFYECNIGGIEIRRAPSDRW